MLDIVAHLLACSTNLGIPPERIRMIRKLRLQSCKIPLSMCLAGLLVTKPL